MMYQIMESLRKMFLRDNTTSKSDESKTIDFSRQQIVNILAIRGEGKSYLLDGFKEKYYYQGYLILDLHSPPNLENATSEPITLDLMFVGYLSGV